MLKQVFDKYDNLEGLKLHSDYAEKNTIPKFWIRQMKIA